MTVIIALKDSGGAGSTRKEPAIFIVVLNRSDIGQRKGTNVLPRITGIGTAKSAFAGGDPDIAGAVQKDAVD